MEVNVISYWDIDHMDDYLFELQQLGSLHQVLQLKSALRHVVRLAPFFYPRDIVLDLHG